MRGLVTSRVTSAVAAGLLVLVIAGGGYAIASDGGTIQACAHKRTHVLYTGKCSKGDKKLSWSQVGPRGGEGPRGVIGPIGPRGAAGAGGSQGVTGGTGVTGPIGPSEAFNTTSASGRTDIALGEYTPVLSLTLPTGSYTLNAEVVATNQSTTTDVNVRCALLSQTDPQMTDTSLVHLPAGGSAAIPLQGVQVITASSSLQSVQCQKDALVVVAIGADPQFTATMVGSIASQ